MLAALYVALTFLSLIPFSLMLRLYLSRVKIDLLVNELRELSERLDKIKKQPSYKDKRVRIIGSKYNMLRRKLRSLFFLNLVVMWAAIFAALTVSNTVTYIIAERYGIELLFRSPINVPGVTVLDNQLNALILLLAVILVYQPLHNKISLMEKLYS